MNNYNRRKLSRIYNNKLKENILINFNQINSLRRWNMIYKFNNTKIKSEKNLFKILHISYLV